MKALRRKEPQVLDILVECLMDQEEANKDIIKRIRQGTVCAAGGLGGWGAGKLLLRVVERGVRVLISLLCSVP